MASKLSRDELKGKCREFLQSRVELNNRINRPKSAGGSGFRIGFTLPLRFAGDNLDLRSGPYTQHDVALAGILPVADSPDLRALLNDVEFKLELEEQELSRLAEKMAAILEDAAGEGEWEFSIDLMVDEVVPGDLDPFSRSGAFGRLAMGDGLVSPGGFSLKALFRASQPAPQESGMPATSPAAVSANETDRNEELDEAILRVTARVRAESAYWAMHNFCKSFEAFFGALLVLDGLEFDPPWFEDQDWNRPLRGSRFSRGTGWIPVGDSAVPRMRNVHTGREDTWELGEYLRSVMTTYSFSHDFTKGTFLEARAQRDPTYSPMIEGMQQALNVVSRPGNDADKYLESSCRFFLRAQMAHDPGEVALFASIALETVLLDSKVKEQAVARITEAAAQRLGKNRQERARVRKEMDAIYEARSRFVHAGRSDWPVAEQRKALGLVARILKEEILSRS